MTINHNLFKWILVEDDIPREIETETIELRNFARFFHLMISFRQSYGYAPAQCWPWYWPMCRDLDSCELVLVDSNFEQEIEYKELKKNKCVSPFSGLKENQKYYFFFFFL